VQSTGVHPCTDLTNEVLEGCEFLVGNSELSFQRADSLLSRQELVLEPSPILGIRVTD